LKRPFTDELGFGLAQSAGSRLDFSLRFFRRDVRRLIQSVNVGVPDSAFTPVSDGQGLTVYRQDPRTLGRDSYLLMNPDGLNAVSKGLEASVRAGFKRGFVESSFTAYKAVGRGNPGNSELENDVGVVGALYSNPNALVNSMGRLYFDRAYVGKIAAHYEGPFGLSFGSVAGYFDGLPFGFRKIIPDFPQGPFFVMATARGQDGGPRTQYNLIFDQRISHTLRLGERRMSVLVDVFNLLNLNKNLIESDLSGPMFPLRKPLQVQNPRVVRFGLRWNL
jgi:hypothetical protein